MVNDSKKYDQRFWKKWKDSGAVSDSSLEAQILHALNRKNAPKPPLDQMIYLHQAYMSEECIYCRAPIEEWKPIEKCYARYN